MHEQHPARKLSMGTYHDFFRELCCSIPDTCLDLPCALAWKASEPCRCSEAFRHEQAPDAPRSPDDKRK